MSNAQWKKKINVNRLKVNVLHLFHLLPLVNLDSKGRFDILPVCLSPLWRKLWGVLKSCSSKCQAPIWQNHYTTCLLGIIMKLHSFSLWIAPAISQEVYPPTTFIYSSSPTWNGEEEGSFGNQPSDGWSLEDEAEGHPNCWGGLLGVLARWWETSEVSISAASVG